MHRYLLSRLIHSLFVIFGVAVVVFFLIRLSGDPAALYLSPEASIEELEAMRAQLGYDRPLLVQLASFLGGVVRGDFGESLRFREPAMAVAFGRLPATLTLSVTALVFALVTAVPLGVVSALRKNSAVDFGATTVALLGLSMPTFWSGIVAILVFSVYLGWLPTSGAGSWRHLVLPSITLGAYSAGILVRLIRTSVLEVIGLDYVRTATAKGLARGRVITKHVFKNAALPVVTMLGLQFNTLMGSAIVTEQVFNYPGMARLAVQAVGSRDIPVVEAFVILTAVIIVLVNLLVDLAYLSLDPRIRYS